MFVLRGLINKSNFCINTNCNRQFNQRKTRQGKSSNRMLLCNCSIKVYRLYNDSPKHAHKSCFLVFKFLYQV